MNLFDVIIFSSGTILGIYLNQRYILPNIKNVVNNVFNVLKQYEPPKKNENEDIEMNYY